jgi:epoxyqueuosine reductase
MSSNPEIFKKLIKAEAKNLGFCLIGISAPQELNHYSKYQNWIQTGKNAGMTYLASKTALEAKIFPPALFPDCKSIISLAAQFPNPNQYQNATGTQPTSGILASYALGTDYHEILMQQMTLLMTSVIDRTGNEVKWMSAVDTLPMAERELAVQAGLGWIGKNGMLNTLEYGSTVFLSEIMLDLALPPDEPQSKDFCGECNLCVDACPTHCILPDRTLDANRCLSYLTIEHRGEIPSAFHEVLGERIFGCDTCIVVCPWNQKSKSEPRIQALFPESLTNQLDIKTSLPEIIEHFHRYFQHSAIRRAGKVGFLRNCLIRLANAQTANADQLMDEIVSRFPHPDIIKYYAVLSNKDSRDNKKELE